MKIKVDNETGGEARRKEIAVFLNFWLGWEPAAAIAIISALHSVNSG